MDLSGYNTNELANVVDLDAHAVRDEAIRRADRAAKAAARAKAALAKAMAELDECEKALRAALAA